MLRNARPEGGLALAQRTAKARLMRKRDVLPALFGFFMTAVAVPTFAQDDEIRWLDNYRETLQEAKRTQKPIFVEFRCEP